MRYFVAVAEELNFRKAAQQLHVSNPTLSIQVKKLESLLGVQLLERDTTHVRLTELGEMFLRDSRKLLHNVNTVVTAIREAGHGEPGHLRIGIPMHFIHSFILKALSIHHRRHPKTDVSFAPMKTDDDQARALKEGRIHVAFAFNHNLPPAGSANHLMILDARLFALMGAQHPLAGEKEVTLSHLAAYPVLVMAEYEQHDEDMAAIFRRKKLHPAIQTTDTNESCLAMLAAKEGVSLVSNLQFATHYPELVLLPIKDAVPEARMQLHASWGKNDATPQVRNFVEVLRELRAARE